MLSFNTTRALLCAGLLAAAGGAQAAPAGAITGTITDKASAAPIALESYPNVILYQCLNEGDTFCSGFTGFAEADASGAYSIPTADIPAGRYQLLAGAADYSYLYSATFDLAPGDGLKKKLQLSPLPVSISDVVPCETIASDGYCTIHYTLTSRLSKDKSVQLWAQLNGHGNMPAGTDYSTGDASYKALQVKLAAGASVAVTQAIYLGLRDPGSYAQVGLYASPAGQPYESIGYYSLGQLTLGSSGVIASTSAASLRQDQQRAARSRPQPSALQAGATASAPGAFIVGTLTAADTGAPLDVSLSPRIRLVPCLNPTDTYCSTPGGSGEWVYLDETGEYRLNTRAIVAGRYQIEAQVRSGYGLARSVAFDAPSQGSSRMDLVAPKPILGISNVGGCNVVISASGGCTLEYDATNNSGSEQTLWVWTKVGAYLSGSPLGVSEFTAGNGKTMQPQKLKIASGASVHMSQPVVLSAAPKAGSEFGLTLFVGPANDPAYVDSALSLGSVVVQAQ